MIWWAAGFMAVGWLVVERGHPLPGLAVASVGSWVTIWWAATLVVA